MLLTVGVLAGLLECQTSGQGQVVDTSVVDGATTLTSADYDLLGQGARTDERWTYIADGCAPFYNTYATADGRYVAVSAVEPQFYEELVAVLGLDVDELPEQADRASWPKMKELFGQRFRTRTRDQWCELAAGTDACVAPVLTLSEAPTHPHHLARGTFIEVDGVPQPAPMPFFDRTPAALPRPRPRRGQHTVSGLLDWGFQEDDIVRLLNIGAVVSSSAPDDLAAS
jgi:alpha-methylacyl-CoA racemase